MTSEYPNEETVYDNVEYIDPGIKQEFWIRIFW